MELRGSQGIRGYRGGSSKIRKYEHFKHIIGQRSEAIANGVTEEEVSIWVDELSKANRNVACADPDLVAMETEQVQKRSERYMAASLGHLSTEKPEGFNRFMMNQLNGIASEMTRKTKVEQSTMLINTYDVDVQAFIEPGMNWGQLKSSETYASFFDAEIELRSVTGHNKNENPPTEHQQGGTGIMGVGEMLEYWRNPGSDWRGLGRWTSVCLEGSPVHRTRVVSAYCLGRSRAKGWGRVYQQHLRYIQEHGLDTTPYALFCDDLIIQLQRWTAQGDRLILLMDANEHVITGSLTSQLTDYMNGLDLEEISSRAWGFEEPNTFIDGHKPIDGVWASQCLEIGGFKLLSFGESIGDHRTMIFDVSTRSLLGKYEHRVVRAGCRRLNCRTTSMGRYNKLLETLMTQNRMDERLDAVLEEIVNDRPTVGQQRRMDILDEQFVQLQKHAESKCRKILKPDMVFSGPVKLWHERVQAYKALVRWKKGNSGNVSNIMRTALRRGIDNPREMSLQEMENAVLYCQGRKRLLKETAPSIRREEQRNKLLEAEAAKKTTRAKKIRANINREGNRKMWYFINRSQKDPRSGAPHIVQRETPLGGTEDSTCKEDTEGFIFDTIEYRFQLANDAPISKTMLIDQLGHLADTDIAQQIVEGSFEIPDEIDDSTALILEEIGKIGVKMTNGDVTITITPEEFQYFWKRVKERTSSSLSGIHYGHYKAAAHSDRISSFLAKKITLISRTGCPPERWSYGLTVMLEKIAGLALVSKLRAILLMEADFNMHNKLIFGKRMLDRARAEGIIPPEQYSDKEHTSEDGTFDKILQSDISRQKRIPLCIVSADAANCYDRVHHAIMALMFLAVGVHSGAIVAMLRSIQLMKFFLRTGWGESSSFIGGDILRILHGLCQGNGAAPASWLIVSSILVRAYKTMGFGASMQAPITRVWLDTAGVIFVDDTDLFIMHECSRSGLDIFYEAQDSLTCWGKLLIATGGTLKPEKCFYYMVDYEWLEDGSWQYTEMVDMDLFVPCVDGSEVEIDQLPVDESKKTLGIWTNPAGDCSRQLEAFVMRLTTWTNRLSAGKLPSRWAWVSYFHQLWPGLDYGLGVNSSPVEDLEDQEDEGGPLRKIYRKMLPFLGINRNIKAGWRHLHTTFGGIGLRKLLSEVVISRLNLFLQHYDTPSTLGLKLNISLQSMQLEAGTAGCPLLTSYRPLGPLTTPCWCRSLWEGLDHYGFSFHLDYPTQQLPRENDELLIDVFQRSDLTTEELRSLQRCRISWEMLFLSDIVGASGRQLDRRCLSPPNASTVERSTFTFGIEQPSVRDWAFWARFWEQFTLPGAYLTRPLGKWLHPTHHQWKWFHDQANNILECVTDDGVDYYIPCASHRTRSEQVFTLVSSAHDDRQPTGVPCSVARLDENSVRFLSSGPCLAIGPSQPDKFWDFLKAWGGNWMWANIVNEGADLTWVVEAITNSTAVWVTDGSYNKDVAPLISGAGWILFCTRTKQRLYGSFFEVSPNAGSYRAELLGLLAIHLLASAIEQYFGLSASTAVIACDNKGALFKSKEYRRRIPNSASQADIKRVLRNVKTKLKVSFEYEWVRAHQDDIKLWHQLTLLQQLNCICDTLAKAAVTRSLTPTARRIPEQVLPTESAAVFVGGIKQTTNLAKNVRLVLGRVDAEAFYTTPLGIRDKNGKRNKRGGLGWTKASFDAVDWDTLDATLESKPQMYRQWLSKQSSGFCGTQQMVAHWDPTRDGNCPDCHRPETASHLCLCPNGDRTRLLKDMTADLTTWLNNNYAHPELAYWLPKYILLRGTAQLTDFPQMSAEMATVARSQDLIPWTSFMEGKLSSEIFRLQNRSLACSPSLLTTLAWSKKLISQILHITHAQWIFRNLSLHHNTIGYLRLTQRREVLAEIDRLSQMDLDAVPDESKYLLEIDFSSLKNDSLVSQSYWLFAIKAAKTAGQRALLRSQRETGGAARRMSTREDQVRAARAAYATHHLATGRLSTSTSSPYSRIRTETRNSLRRSGHSPCHSLGLVNAAPPASTTFI